MDRNAPEDQVEIGIIVEDALKGSFGSVMRLIIEGMKSEYLSTSENHVQLPADRTLGRLEALSKLQDRLDYCVSISQQLRTEVKEEKKV